MRTSAYVCHIASQHVMEQILIGSGCTIESIAVAKYSLFSIGRMVINNQYHHTVCHWSQSASRLGITKGTIRFRQGWIAIHIHVQKLIIKNRRMTDILQHAQLHIWRTFIINWSLLMADHWQSRLTMHLLKLRDNWYAAMNYWGLWSRVAWIDKPLSMHTACHTADRRWNQV
jgi:hypothetical protein